MNASNTNEEQTNIARNVALLSGAGVLALCLCLAAYTRYGGPVLARLDQSVGEVLAEEGRRFHEGGAVANARERYEAALASDFAGAQNRAATEKRLGQLLYESGDFAAALPHLKAATVGGHPQLSAFALQAEALLNLGQLDALPGVLAAWGAVAESLDRNDQRALVAYYSARLAAEQGDKEAALAALERATAIAPGGRSASDLAQRYYEAGELEKARKQIDAYLLSGAVGKRSEWMRKLRARIERELAAQAPDGNDG